MVKTIWVLENVRKHLSFYRKFDTLMLLASAIQWRKHNSNSELLLYCDELTYNFIHQNSFNIVYDNVIKMQEDSSIDKDVFWASSKVQVISGQKDPFIIMDNDFIVYNTFESFLKDKVIVGHEENGQDYYPMPLDPYVKATKDILNRPNHKSVNCCFLYFPNPSFASSYGLTSMELMRRLTELKAPNSNYLVYAEQLLLKHLLDKYNIDYIGLINEEWQCKDLYFKQIGKGLIDSKAKWQYFRHYWMEKPKIYNSTEGYSLKEETALLESVVLPKIKQNKAEFNSIFN